MKKRLDILVTERGLAESREKAKALIMAGQIYVDNQKADKPGDTFPEECRDRIPWQRPALRQPGRPKAGKGHGGVPHHLGGQNLHGHRRLNRRFYRLHAPKGRAERSTPWTWATASWPGTCATTPGWSTWSAPTPGTSPGSKSPRRWSFVSVDVSFISLTLILPPVRQLLAAGGQAVCLIKPQFEAGREKVGKKGVVRDRAVHEEVIEKIRCFALENGYSVLGLTYSPVKGPEGNIEYLIYLERSEEPVQNPQVPPARQVVEQSHQALDKPAEG